MSSAGPIFWGLFLACGLVVAGYALWMWGVEREDARSDADAEVE